MDPRTTPQNTDTLTEFLPKVFTRTNGREFDYVFNCIQKGNNPDLPLILGRECAKRKISAFVELSTGMIYKSPSSKTIASGGCTESAPTKPWVKSATDKLVAEEALQKLPGLKCVVLRLAHVYGEYDVGILSRGLCLAKIYQSQEEEMKWLYGKELRINTVHVEDVCSAAWRAAEWRATVKDGDREVKDGGIAFNIVDNGDTCTYWFFSLLSRPVTYSLSLSHLAQALLASLISSIFHISTGFASPLLSTFARLNISRVTEELNEDMLDPWADLLDAAGITRAGPITPWMEKELLKDCDLCLNGSRAEKVLGFRPTREKLGEEEVRAVIESYKRQHWWP